MPLKAGADKDARDGVTWATRLHSAALALLYLRDGCARRGGRGVGGCGRRRRGEGCGGCTLYTILYNIALRYAAALWLLCLATRCAPLLPPAPAACTSRLSSTLVRGGACAVW